MQVERKKLDSEAILEVFRDLGLEDAKERDKFQKLAELSDWDTLKKRDSEPRACMLTFSQTPATKIIENHKGVAFIKITQQVMIAGQPTSSQEMEKGLIKHPEDNK